LFTDNQFGIASSHGNYYVYDTRFERSNISDLFLGSSGCTSCSLWRTVSVNSSMFSLNGGWCGVGLPTKMHDCRVHGYGRRGAAAIAATLGLPAAIPAVAQVWRGPLLVVDTQFTPAADIGQPAVASWNASLSRKFLNAAGFLLNQPGVWNETWTKTYLFANSVLHGRGPMLVSDPWDTAHNLSAGKILPSPISEHTIFMPTSWRVPSKVFDAVRDFGALGNGSLTDGVAVQACVDAAAAHGAGASCYLRPGRFDMNKTIVLKGRDFVFEGSGITTMITAAMPPGLTENDSLVVISPTLAVDIVVQQMAMYSKKVACVRLPVGPLWH
jgi:hypothetical protein